MAEKGDAKSSAGGERKIADASELFRDAEPARPGRDKARPAPGGAAKPAGADMEGYELEDTDEPQRVESVRPIFPEDDKPKVARRRTPSAEAPARERDSAPAAADATVEEVWSRAGEWGMSLMLLGLVGCLVAFLLYQSLAFESAGLAGLVLLAGGAAMLYLSYPIVITLERPVRITPEQAIKDYYGALSHHIPHYRRMWLLLSSAGRSSAGFHSYDGFKAYWKDRLAQLKGDKVGKWTPLVFRVDEFKSEKSAGLTSIDVKYTLNILPRDKQEGPPLDSVRVSMSLVKGPDKMWYLNKGTLPGDRVVG